MSSTLNIPRPTTGTGHSLPSSVVIQAQALFQILDHALRRKEGQSRVIGTVLGVRSEDGLEVEIRSAYGVPHDETDDQVIVGIEHNRSMLALHRRANPRDAMLGWYATSSELNNLSGLIHDFYSQTMAYPAIHLTVDAADNGVEINAYVASPVGISPEKGSGNCIFVPVQCEVRYSDVEKSALNVISEAKYDESRTVDLLSDISALETSISEVQEMLQRVSAYVSRVTSGQQEGNAAVGKFLLKSLAAVPSLSTNTLEKLFNSHLQDVLMVNYLANTVKTQLQLASRLTPLV
jgi:translation initiation factor 3 subunit F